MAALALKKQGTQREGGKEGKGRKEEKGEAHNGREDGKREERKKGRPSPWKGKAATKTRQETKESFLKTGNKIEKSSVYLEILSIFAKLYYKTEETVTGQNSWT